jgi:hypothetical protein
MTPNSASRKASRAGLYGPWLAFALLLVAWSGWWIWLSGEAARRLDAEAAALRAHGFQVAWAERRIGGYPFRLDVDFEGLRLAEPSGWGLAAPTLQTEAYAWNPGRWMLVAPSGGTFVRPLGGPVQVGASVLRASVSGLDRSPPEIVIEGHGLRFTPAPGARPFFVSAADALVIATRPGPNDQGAIFLSLDGARAQLSGLMGRIAEGGLVSLKGDVIVSHVGAVSGADWPAAVRAWSAAGGTLQVRQVTVAAGEALLDARSGQITVDDNGRLAGTLTASLRQAPRALSAMSQAGAIQPGAARSAAAAAGGDAAHVVLDFQGGQTRLGAVTLGPAPRIF